jgi:membrane associated rhomboid family serine protease
VNYEPDSLQADSRRLRQSFHRALAFTGLLWAVKAVEVMFHLDLVQFGVYPRHASGLTGVLFAPLIHASWSHLVANSLPVVILGTALFYGYPRSAIRVLPLVWLGSGLGVWLFAREAYHVGASGLTTGALFFLLVIGILRWDRRAIVIAMIVFFLYGGMIWGILPSKPDISFESHLSGALTGIVLAIGLKNLDPPPAEKKYSWEDEVEEGPGDPMDRDDD